MTDEQITIDYMLNDLLRRLWTASDQIKYYSDRSVRDKALERLDSAETEIIKCKQIMGVTE